VESEGRQFVSPFKVKKKPRGALEKKEAIFIDGRRVASADHNIEEGEQVLCNKRSGKIPFWGGDEKLEWV